MDKPMNEQAPILMTTKVLSQAEVAVKAIGLSKNYGEFEAIKELHFEVLEGQMLALLGHNGAGKSTLIKLILGLISPSSGQLFVQGQDVQAKRTKGCLSLGYLPENVSFYDNMTAIDLLSYFAKLKGVTPRRVRHLLEEFGLMAAKDKPLRTFSKGMRQRLGLAQAVLADPKVLLLDEPTVGLDPLASAFLYQKMAQLKAQGCAVIISTHELGLVQDQMDRALILGQGKMLASGDLTNLRAATSLPSQIELYGLTPLQYQQLQALPLLASLLASSTSESVRLSVPVGLKAKVIQQLSQDLKLNQFSVEPPSLQGIFHFYMESLNAEHVLTHRVLNRKQNFKPELVV